MIKIGESGTLVTGHLGALLFTMTKKAKGQASMGSEVTYQELKKLEHGSKEARFGVDSQLAFG